MKSLNWLIRAAAVLGFCSAMYAAPAIAAENGSFVDRFDKLDEGRWQVSHDWSNGDHQNCGWSRDEVRITNGNLVIGFSNAPMAGKTYRCGEIQSHAAFGYGTYETVMKTPAGSGLNAAFFSYIGPPQGKPHDEIDFEVLLKDTSRVQTGGFAAGKGIPVALPELPSRSDAAFIHYAFEWAPDRVRYFINGKLAHEITDPALLPKNDQKIYFSLWGTDTLNDWLGPFTAPAGPINMAVEWVAFTARGEKCQFPESIVCKTELK